MRDERVIKMGDTQDNLNGLDFIEHSYVISFKAPNNLTRSFPILQVWKLDLG